MGARLDTVARYVCDRGRWAVSNLALQKIVYLAQMLHMGRHEGERLVDCYFEAWDWGPVAPDLYHQVKMFGSAPIKDVFFAAREFDDGDKRRLILDEVCDVALKMRPGELVEITHWPRGAWAKHYAPGHRGIVIPDPDIYAEYVARLGATERA